MVHEKKQSGDPDYDDKVPHPESAAGPVVTAGDGKVIGRIDPAVGPVTLEGSHLVMDEEPAAAAPVPKSAAGKTTGK